MSLRLAALTVMNLAIGMTAPLTAVASELKAVVKTGYDFSGDPIFSTRFTNGETDRIRANEGLILGGGIIFINDAKTIETELTLSWKFQDLNASNGGARWRRYPLEILIFRRRTSIRFGGGFTYHLNPRLEGDGILSNVVDLEFKDALGVVVAADYLLTERVSVGIRYTWLEYEQQASGIEHQSNGGGVGLAIRF